MLGEEIKDDLTADDFEAIKRWSGRLLRCASYAMVAFILISVNTYGLEHRWPISFGIGILGGGTTSARYGLFGIAILLLMAVVPLGAVHSIVEAFR